MKTAVLLSVSALAIIWIRRRKRHPLSAWVEAFYDEAVLR